MSRSCWRTLSLLLLMASFFGFDQRTVSADESYILRLVFDGLITVAREPGQAWILVGNASEPQKLLVGKKIPPHMSHLLVRVQDEDGNVEAMVSGQLSGGPLASPATQPGLPGFWQATMLTGEDLRLETTTSTQFELPFDKFRRRQPCNPKHWYFFCWQKRSARQHKNLGWTVDLDDILAKLPGSACDKKIKSCLTQEPYGCQDSPALLNARLKLDNAEIFVSELFGERTGTVGGQLPQLPHFTLEAAGRPVSRVRVQARLVTAKLIVSGPVRITSRRLDGSETEKILEIRGKPGKTVEVRLANHTEKCTSLEDCKAKGFTDNDFLFNFNLLNNPRFIDVSQFPVPVQVTMLDDPTFNSQCSPSSYRP